MISDLMLARSPGWCERELGVQLQGWCRAQATRDAGGPTKTFERVLGNFTSSARLCTYTRDKTKYWMQPCRTQEQTWL